MHDTIEPVSARLALLKIARATAALSGAPLTERLVERRGDRPEPLGHKNTGRGLKTGRGGQKTGRFSVRLVPLGRGDAPGRQQPAVCGRCRDRACAAVCPTGALGVNRQGRVGLDHDRCLGCGYCAVACPHGVVRVAEVAAAGGRGVIRHCVVLRSAESVTGDGRPRPAGPGRPMEEHAMPDRESAAGGEAVSASIVGR